MAKEEAATIESLQEKIAFLEMKFDELSGKHGGKPRVKKQDAKDFHDKFGKEAFTKEAITTGMTGLKSGAKQLIPRKVLMMPTKENPFHEQGKKFECEFSLAKNLHERGFATPHQTWDEHTKEIEAAEEAENAKK